MIEMPSLFIQEVLLKRKLHACLVEIKLSIILCNYLYMAPFERFVVWRSAFYHEIYPVIYLVASCNAKNTGMCERDLRCYTQCI